MFAGAADASASDTGRSDDTGRSAAEKAGQAAAVDAAAATSDGSPAGDLWSGFSSATSPSVLAAPAATAAQDGGIGSSFALGLALAALGLAGLTGALLLGGLRRRRALVGRGADTD